MTAVTPTETDVQSKREGTGGRTGWQSWRGLAVPGSAGRWRAEQDQRRGNQEKGRGEGGAARVRETGLGLRTELRRQRRRKEQGLGAGTSVIKGGKY